MHPGIERLLGEIGNVDLSSSNLGRMNSQFAIWFETIGKWNRWINLVSRSGPGFEHHLYDALQYLKAIPEKGWLLDIGSGAGFPGIALKIVRPSLRLVLLDSHKKRSNFLKTLTRDLGLNDTQTLCCRAEEIREDPGYREKFDFVTLRGVGGPKLCIDLGGPFLKTGQCLIIKQGLEEMEDKSVFGFELEKEIPVTGLQGTKSKIMVFFKCST